MTTSILQRIHALADKPPSADACKAAASILRKLATDEGAVQKAHAITGTLADFEPAGQIAILDAVEKLGA